MKKPEIVKRLHAGQMLPPFYGIAWDVYERNERVCMPVPFNLIAGAIRRIWIFLIYGWRSVPIYPRDAYRQGYIEGYRDGYFDNTRITRGIR